jgi:hypothetical protein
MLQHSDAIHELVTALAHAQGVMEGATKDAANPFFKSKYADLASVWDACRGPLAAHGLAVVQVPSMATTDAGPVVTVETLLAHSSGQWVRGAVSAAPKDDSPQAIGSVITYLRRYALQSIVGVAPEDDDAETGQGRGSARMKAVPVASAPAGYDGWLLDLLATADEGTAALQSAWKASPAELRGHLTTTENGRWESIKAKAAKVTTAAKAAVRVSA